MSMKKLISLMLILQSACIPMTIPYAAHVEAIQRAMEQCTTHEEITEDAFIDILKKEFNELVTSLQDTKPAVAQQLQEINLLLQRLTVPVSISSIYFIADKCTQSNLNFADLPADEQEKLRALLISMNTFFMRALGLGDSEISHLLAATTQLESDLTYFASLTDLQNTHATELERLLQQPLSAQPTLDIPDFDAAKLFEKFDAEDDALDEEEDDETKKVLLKAFLASSGIAGAFFIRNVFTHIKANPRAKVIDPATIWAGLKSISQPLKIVGGIIVGAAILYKLSKWIHKECKEKRKKLKKTYKDNLDEHKKSVKKDIEEFEKKMSGEFKKRETDAKALQEKLEKQAEAANKLYSENIKLSGTSLREATQIVEATKKTAFEETEALKKQLFGDVDLFKRKINAELESNRANTREICAILEQLQTLLNTANIDAKTKEELEKLQKELGKKVVSLQDSTASSPSTAKKKGGFLSRLRRKSSSKVSPGGAGSGSDGEALSGNSAKEDSGMEVEF